MDDAVSLQRNACVVLSREACAFRFGLYYVSNFFFSFLELEMWVDGYMVTQKLKFKENL